MHLQTPIILIFFQPTTEDEVKNLITNFQIKKTAGPNSIPILLLQNLKDTISQPLSTLVNLAFEMGIYPDSFKIAKIVPVFKKGDPLSTNNYRPISLFSNLGKLMEKIIHHRIYNFLQKNNSLYS